MPDPYQKWQIDEVASMASTYWDDIEDHGQTAVRAANMRNFEQALAQIEDAEHLLRGMRSFLETGRDMQQSNERVALAEGRI